MRNITKDALEAFDSNTPFHRDNTGVYVTRFGTILLLHGNPIAEKLDTGGLYIKGKYDGEVTKTTKERLNGLDGVGVHHCKGELFLNGKAWDGEEIRIK